MDKHFQTDHIKGDLKGLSVRGGAATTIAQVPKFFLMLISNFVILRFLVPEDVGLVGMATIGTGLVVLFQDMGLPTAMIQHKDVGHELASVMFWINVGTSLVLMLIAMALAPAVALLFGEPRLKAIISVIACSFIVSALSGQHRALLHRHMRFPALAAIDIVSMATGVTVGGIMAIRGDGYWALVFMPIASSLVMMTGLWIVTGWIPMLPGRGTGVRSMLKFGLNLTGSRVINFFTEKVDYIMVGWMWGAGPLGMYTKGYQLLTLGQSQLKAPISSVAIAGLSRLRDEPERYARYYLRVIRGIAWLTAPLTGMLAAVATDLIILVLLPKWETAGQIFKIFAFLAILKPVHDTVIWIFISQGRSDRFRDWSVIFCVIIMLAVAVGLPFGIHAVAISYTIFYVLVIIPWSLPYALKGTMITVRDVVKSTGLAIGSGFIMYGVGQAITSCLAGVHPIKRILLSMGGCLLTIILMLFFVRPVRMQLKELIELKSELLRKD